eukprot:TRINITY_DN31346_c0_g1_i1.p1 TRINITY_DN31346_c0_g1~~TRINITY_DN31346_c0_g1_i1.p1  ORF type:complete len:173 (+),score=20.28 TRINITY_DN31346_c0_g1_i1:67-585(+)
MVQQNGYQAQILKERTTFKKISGKQFSNKQGASACFSSSSPRPCMVDSLTPKSDLRDRQAKPRLSRSDYHFRRMASQNSTASTSFNGSLKGGLPLADRPCLTPSPKEPGLDPTCPPGIANIICSSKQSSAPGLRSQTPRSCMSYTDPATAAPLQHSGIDIGFIRMPPPFKGL